MKKNVVFIYDQLNLINDNVNDIKLIIDKLMRNINVYDIKIISNSSEKKIDNIDGSDVVYVDDSALLSNVFNEMLLNYLNKLNESFNFIFMLSDVVFFDEISFLEYVSGFIGNVSDVYVAVPVVRKDDNLWDRFFVVIDDYVFRKIGLFKENVGNINWMFYEFSKRFYRNFSFDNVLVDSRFPIYFSRDLFVGYDEFDKEYKDDIVENVNYIIDIDDNILYSAKENVDVICLENGEILDMKNILKYKVLNSVEELNNFNFEKYIWIYNSDIFLNNKFLFENFDVLYFDENFNYIKDMKFDLNGNPVFKVLLKRKNNIIVFLYIEDYYHLSFMLTNIINQTILPNKIIIIDNVLSRFDIREEEIFRYHLNVITSKNIYYELLWLDHTFDNEGKINVIKNIISSKTNIFDYVLYTKYSSLVFKNNWVEDVINLLSSGNVILLDSDKRYIFYEKINSDYYLFDDNYDKEIKYY